jgi:hypothetical protein
LRARSARVLEEWYLVGVEGTNECFAEWDQRLERTEREVNRRRGVEDEVFGDEDGDEEQEMAAGEVVESKKEEVKEEEAVLGDDDEEEDEDELQETAEPARLVMQEETVLGDDDSEDEEEMQGPTAATGERAVLGDE